MLEEEEEEKEKDREKIETIEEEKTTIQDPRGQSKKKIYKEESTRRLVYYKDLVWFEGRVSKIIKKVSGWANNEWFRL